MANTPIYDPRDSEVLSPLMAGFSEALYKISKTLNLKTKEITNVRLEKLPWVNSQGKTVIGVLYQAPNGNRLWLNSPAPVIRKNGNVINPAIDNFIIDPIGGGLFFQENYALTDDDVVTVDATIVIDESNVIAGIMGDIKDLQTKAAHDKGYFEDESALSKQYPTGVGGDFALVGTTDTIWIWDVDTESWINSHKATDLSNYYTKPETDNLLGEKEPNITPKGDNVADDNFYYGGRKQWIDLLYKVRNTLLDGLDTSADGVVSATDTLIAAIGKLQAQATKASETNSTQGNDISAIKQKNTEQDEAISSIQQKDSEQDGKISGNTEKITALEQDKADKTELPNKVFTATLSVDSWNLVSEGIYTQSITNENVTANDKLNLSPTTDSFLKEIMDAGIVGMVVKNDSGTLSVLLYGDKPKQEISVNIEIVPTKQI